MNWFNLEDGESYEQYHFLIDCWSRGFSFDETMLAYKEHYPEDKRITKNQICLFFIILDEQYARDTNNERFERAKAEGALPWDEEDIVLKPSDRTENLKN